MSKFSVVNAKDHDLWNAFRQGDEIAFGQIARKFYRSLFSYGSKFSKNREFVKDCIQDLYFELWTRRETLGDTDFVKFYLLKSLRRKIHRESNRLQLLSVEADLDFDAEAFQNVSIEDQIIEIESNEEQIRLLNHHIKLLQKRQQEALYLKFYENLDNESIAQVMSISKQAVANILFRSIRDLKARL